MGLNPDYFIKSDPSDPTVLQPAITQPPMMEVKLLDSMGNDVSVVNAARVSFNKEVEQFSGRDKGLIRYLAKHNHWTPFSQVQYQVRCKMPIFVARQWFKHQIGITRNEVSRRYVSDPPEFYEPEAWRGKPENGAKQGSSEKIIQIGDEYDLLVNTALMSYNSLLERGVCPEQARMVLPQCMFTEFIETGSLSAAARICKLRLDPHAQYEIREFTKLFEAVVAPIAPVSWKELMR